MQHQPALVRCIRSGVPVTFAIALRITTCYLTITAKHIYDRLHRTADRKKTSSCRDCNRRHYT